MKTECRKTEFLGQTQLTSKRVTLKLWRNKDEDLLIIFSHRHLNGEMSVLVSGVDYLNTSELFVYILGSWSELHRLYSSVL